MRHTVVDHQIDIETDTTSLTSQVYQRIHSMIIRGDLEPGHKLKIDDLRKILDAGATPVREALSLLTSDHLVERIDQRGFVVAQVSVESFQELLKTRCWLEDRALRESIKEGDASWEENLILCHHRLKRAPRSVGEQNFISNADWEAHHKKFHMALLSACGSSILLKICDQLYDQNIRYRNLVGPMAYPMRDVTSEHDSIVHHALDRNADLAVHDLVAHYTKTGEFLEKHLS